MAAILRQSAIMSSLPTQLALDTSTTTLSLCLTHQGRYWEYHQEAGQRQSELILPAIGALLAEAGVTIAALEALVYAQGPGAFTGLRIGIGVAQGLAAPWNLPLIGIPCLDAVAALAPDEDCVLAATDARMGELFYAWFDTHAQTRLSPYCVGPAAAIRLPASRSGGVGVGNAYALLDTRLPVAGRAHMPRARHYLQLAATGHYPATDAADASLLYVRDKVALTAAEQAARKGGA